MAEKGSASCPGAERPTSLPVGKPQTGLWLGSLANGVGQRSSDVGSRGDGWIKRDNENRGPASPGSKLMGKFAGPISLNPALNRIALHALVVPLPGKCGIGHGDVQGDSPERLGAVLDR